MDEVVERVRGTETQEATMYVAGIDAHATYVVVAIVSKTGELVQKATRVTNTRTRELLELLEPFRPLEALVETCPAWPWLHDLLVDHDHGFVLAYSKTLSAIAEADSTRAGRPGAAGMAIVDFTDELFGGFVHADDGVEGVAGPWSSHSESPRPTRSARPESTSPDRVAS